MGFEITLSNNEVVVVNSIDLDIVMIEIKKLLIKNNIVKIKKLKNNNVE